MWFKVGQKGRQVSHQPTSKSHEVMTDGVFVNTYVHTLDGKKRLTIPSDWRELAGAPGRLFLLGPGGRQRFNRQAQGGGIAKW